MKTKTFVVETATGQKVADDIVDKRGYAERWHFSPRHIDNLIAQGLPHLKIGPRRVRIHVPEADAWMHEKFGTQRIPKVKTSVRETATVSHSREPR